ncbi:tRNA m7G46 methyltransferase [Campylobacter iguaniorum]|uniref:tRNA (guanosine(46)-N7)-methyltransferase TrmB n=1 Tax=Campylobacter iguaniorum TaxID=1244531 RepID=UPI00073A2947|nr:tRNA (guanosine(46)-N7)-methyltransferase TrmB [Campylobacter iguaniorum]ALV24913.1 tRNA m7G46 methyltransferase [Campylobacter iguaniorum]
MPNFIATSLKNLEYPFGDDEAQFLWSAKAGEENLIYTMAKDCEFFITVKGKKDNYVIKGEKLTRPARLGVLQKALISFRDLNVNAVKSQAIAIKNEKQLQAKEFILSDVQFLDLLQTTKFKRIFVEIGFGSGRHLLYQARNNPEVLVVGIEVYKPSCEQVNNLAKDQNLKNIALLNLDARLVLSLIESNSIEKVFLHFPIPWEKSEKRRVVSASFAKEVQRILAVGAKFELRSDDRGYTDFTIGHFLNLPDAQIQIYKDRFLEVSSKYEDRWVRQNKNIYDMIFTNELDSPKQSLKGDFEFGNIDKELVAAKFENKIFKGDDYFLHVERLYKKENGDLLIRVAFGSFYRPEHCYILITPNEANYFIKKPLLTSENLKAHECLREYLTCKIS